MLTACFDASGTERDTKFLVFGGFVSTAHHWVEFSEEWQTRLTMDGLSYLRMAEFRHFRGDCAQYRNDEKIRRVLLGDLIAIIRRYAFRRFAGALENRVFRRLSKPALAKFQQSAYVLGGREVANMVRKWMEAERIGDPRDWGRPPLQLIYDKGDLNQNHLRERLLSEGYVEPLFRYKADTVINGQSHPGFIPLQAADLMAYEVFQFLKHPERDAARWPLRELLRMPGRMDMGTISTLKEMETFMNVNDTIRAWIIRNRIPMRDI